jgi:hypothetical protein
VTTGENASVIARLFEAYTEGRKDEALQLLAGDVMRVGLSLRTSSERDARERSFSTIGAPSAPALLLHSRWLLCQVMFARSGLFAGAAPGDAVGVGDRRVFGGRIGRGALVGDLRWA